MPVGPPYDKSKGAPHRQAPQIRTEDRERGDASGSRRLTGGGLAMATDEGQNLSGIGKTIADALVTDTGPAPSPRDKLKEELHLTKGSLKQLEHEYRRLKGEANHLNRSCAQLDHENRKQKDTIQNLRQQLESTKLHSNTTDNDRESLLAARAILDGTGATPVMDFVEGIRALHRENVKVSNFLADNIKHFSYELFQEELDRCSQDSTRMVGERLSNFLHEHCEAEELSQALIKITIQIFIVSFCASEWESYLDQQRGITAHVDTDGNTAKHKDRKALFLRNLISVFKIAAWVVPGLAKRAAFEESLNPLFKSMEETEMAWDKIAGFAKLSLSFLSPGDDFANSETYEEDRKGNGVTQTYNALSPPRHEVVLGTASLGIRCIFNQREPLPKTLLTAKVILEDNLRYIFGAQEEQKATTLSAQSASEVGDGRDPVDF